MRLVSAVKQQAVTWANMDPDLCLQMASLGHKVLIYWHLHTMAAILRMAYSNMLEWKYFILIKMALKLNF